MNSRGGDGGEIRKVAVAFDPACGSPDLLHAASELAASLGADLEALFIDDQDISRLSRLPFGRIVEPLSGKSEIFDDAAVRSRRAGPLARSRAILRDLSRRHRLAFSVRELPGMALADAASSSTAELIVVASFHLKFGGGRTIDRGAVCGLCLAGLASAGIGAENRCRQRRQSGGTAGRRGGGASRAPGGAGGDPADRTSASAGPDGPGVGRQGAGIGTDACDRRPAGCGADRGHTGSVGDGNLLGTDCQIGRKRRSGRFGLLRVAACDAVAGLKKIHRPLEISLILTYYPNSQYY